VLNEPAQYFEVSVRICLAPRDGSGPRLNGLWHAAKRSATISFVRAAEQIDRLTIPFRFLRLVLPMPRVAFTPHLRKHLACEPVAVSGTTVAEALEQVFAQLPQLRGYVLDERGRVRQHVMIFVNDRPVADRENLRDAVAAEGEIYVMQALSGG